MKNPPVRATPGPSAALMLAPALRDVVNAVRVIAAEREKTQRMALACRTLEHEATMVRDQIVHILNGSHGEVIALVQALPSLEVELQRELVALMREAFAQRDRAVQLVATRSGGVTRLLAGRSDAP